MIDRLTSTLDFNATALRLRSERTRVLAGNLANADTPNYKSRDFDFSQALSAATGVRSAGSAAVVPTGALSMSGSSSDPGAAMRAASAVSAVSASGRPGLLLERTASGHLPGAGGSIAPPLDYRMPMQTALDANTVEADVERARFAENTLRFEAGLRFLNGQIKSLQTAITGSPQG